MSTVICGHAVSVDGYITGRDPGAGRGLGHGTMPFDWYCRRRPRVPPRSDVGLMGGGVPTSALEADLVDEMILHQAPILLGAGPSFFRELPQHMRLRLLEAVPAPGEIHLHHEVVR